MWLNDQIFTPKTLKSLEPTWNFLSLFLKIFTQPTVRPLSLSSSSGSLSFYSLVNLSLSIKPFDCYHKPFIIRAIEEALCSPRPKHRHGAVLVKSDTQIVAVAKNESIKMSQKLQRIRHAEIGCLAEVMTMNVEQ